MKVFATLLLAVAAHADPAPQFFGGLPYAGHLGYGLPLAHAVVPATHEVTYKTYTPTIETNVEATNLPVPVAVGGYKAVAGDNGDLKGAVHDVPALFEAPALNVQTNEASQGSLTVGTSAVVTHSLGEPIVNEHTVNVPTLGYGYGLGLGHYYGKREAAEEVAAPVVAAAYPFAGYGYGLGHLGYGLPLAHAVVPATHEVTYKTYTPTIETNVEATNLPVPVAVGGYKAVAGDNGDLKGAVHDVPALFEAPALNVQTNEASQGSLTVGTSAVVTHSLGEPIVNEHTVNVPTLGYGYGLGLGHYYGKREAAEEVAAPVVAAAYPFAGYGYGLGHLGYAGLPLAHAVVPATHEVTYKTYTPTVETNVVATNAAVPVAVGGYKAVAGDNGDLKGAVHEVPAIFGAPALNVQTNEASQGSLSVGTSAVVTHSLGEPIVNEHTVNVPTLGYGYGLAGHFYGKREAEADPYLLYGAYGHGYHGYGGYYGLGYRGYGYGGYYGHYYG